MKLTRRLIALLICVLMVATILPVGIFAADATEETTALTSDIDASISFDDIGSTGSNTYIKNKVAASNLTGGGAYTAQSDEGDTNVYAYNEAKQQNGMIYFTNATGYDNLNQPFKVSLRMKLDPLDTTLSTGLYLPVIRACYGTETSGNGAEKTTNLLVVGNKSDGIVRDDETGVIGELIPGYNGTTTYTTTGYKIYANTWYDIVLVYNPTTYRAYFEVTDGTNEYSYGWTVTNKLSRIDYLRFFRTYDLTHNAKTYIDDVVLTTNTDLSFSNDMDNLEFAVDADTSATLTYASAAPALGTSFSASGSENANWTLVEEKDENDEVVNKYIQHVKNGTAAPITWTDSCNLLDATPFEFSWDFKWGTVNSNGAGMFSVKLGGNTIGEIRIINMKGDGNLYFGPGAHDALKIAQLTTDSNNSENGGAQWHNIKAVLIPYITEDRIDMLYRFYIDGEIVAYTSIEDGAYNFYTNASGSWVCTADLQPAKYVEYISAGEDTNGNGVLDEGEDFTISKQWRSGTWGNDNNNTKRVPISLWDGYEYVYLGGSSEMKSQDNVIDGIASIYMFHYNTGELNLDNIALRTFDAQENSIDTVELLGYQLNAKENATAVRFIAGVDSRDFGNIGMDVEMYEMTSENGWVMKENQAYSNTAFVAISADGKSVAAVEHGANYFSVLTVTDIDSSAVIRVTPYVTKDGVRYAHGTPVVYTIVYTDGAGITVTPATTYVRDYDNGVAKGTITDGYAKSTYADLIAPTGDWGSGGEGSGRSVTGVDGTMLIKIDGHYSSAKDGYESYTVTSTDEETGEPTEETVYVLDENGDQIPKYNSMSARYKLANVIPNTYDGLTGNTIIVTAKVKVAEITKMVKVEAKTVGETIYYAREDVVAEAGATAAISFSFFEDASYSKKGTAAAGNIRTYTLAVSEDWVEFVIAIDITEELVGSLKGTKYGEEPIPLRPTISMTSTNGWASELYVDDVTCYVVPTLG